MKYISLCISLEALIDGANEITYKMQRCCAVINSRTVDEGKTIFQNVGKLYTLRSKIVHGASVQAELITIYLEYLIHLVSRTLISILYSKIQKLEEIQVAINPLGFGQMDSPFKDANDIVFNSKIEDLIKELPNKYVPLHIPRKLA